MECDITTFNAADRSRAAAGWGLCRIRPLTRSENDTLVPFKICRFARRGAAEGRRSARAELQRHHRDSVRTATDADQDGRSTAERSPYLVQWVGSGGQRHPSDELPGGAPDPTKPDVYLSSITPSGRRRLTPTAR
jgi:hypothetical protein